MSRSLTPSKEPAISASDSQHDTPDPRGRALARLFGCAVVVLGHALMAYTPNVPTGILWPVREPSEIAALDHIITYGRFAIVGLFFFLAGEAARFGVAFLGSASLLRTARAALLPGLLVGCFIVMPCVYVAWAADAVDRDYIKWEQFWRFRLSIEDKALLIGPGSFWFIEHLLLITLAAYVCVRFIAPLRASVHRLVLPACFATVGVVAWLDPAVLGTFRNDFIPHPAYLAMNACTFAAGWFARGPVRLWPLWILLSFALAFVTPITHTATPWAVPFAAMASLAGVLGWIGACERFAQHLPDLSRLSRLTPGIYVVHLPIVCFGQYVLHPVDASPLVKAGQVTISALVVSAGVAAGVRALLRRRRPVRAKN